MTVIDLLKGVPIDPNNEQQINFPEGDKTEQYIFFGGYRQLQLIDQKWTYYMKMIKLEISFTEAEPINYLIYTNDDNKIYYCFVDRKEYVNERITAFYVSLDYFQTYLFDYELKHSFVEREHQNRVYQTNGKLFPIYNTVPENIAYGEEYLLKNKQRIVDKRAEGTPFVNEWWFVLITSRPLSDITVDPSAYGKVNTPFYIYLIPSDFPMVTENNETLSSFQSVYSNNVDNQFVLAIYPIPYFPINQSVLYDDNKIVITSSAIAVEEIATDEHILRITSTNKDSYSKNGIIEINQKIIDNEITPFTRYQTRKIENEPKLRTFPYHFYYMTDGQGEPLIIKEEIFNSYSMDIVFALALGVSAKYKSFILNYKGDVDGREVALINNKVSDLPLITDAWKNYLLQGKASAQAGLAVSAISTGVGIASSVIMAPATAGLSLGLGLASGGASLGGQIAQHMIREKEIKATPDTVRSQGNNILFDIANNNIHLWLYEKEITQEYKEIIYEYLYYYGYKVNKFKTPEINSRFYFNYIKTINANIKPKTIGQQNAEAMREIKRLYDKGLLIWHVRNNNLDMTFEKENAEMTIEVR